MGHFQSFAATPLLREARRRSLISSAIAWSLDGPTTGRIETSLSEARPVRRLEPVAAAELEPGSHRGRLAASAEARCRSADCRAPVSCRPSSTCRRSPATDVRAASADFVAISRLSRPRRSSTCPATLTRPRHRLAPRQPTSSAARPVEPGSTPSSALSRPTGAPRQTVVPVDTMPLASPSRRTAAPHRRRADPASAGLIGRSSRLRRVSGTASTWRTDGTGSVMACRRRPS